jgi:dephospho-CoA kinase
MHIVGLTGGIASGKSTVSKLIKQEHNIPIIDADIVARQVVEPGTTGYKKIVSYFSESVPDLLAEDGSLNRPALGRAVFGNEPARKRLNSIVHPEVRKETIKQILWAYIRGEPILVLDVPLLFESRFDVICATTITVACDEDVQLDRLLKRDTHLSRDEADKRIASQMKMEDKRKLADVVIDNNGTLQQLEATVSEVIRDLTPNRLLSFTEWIFPPLAFVMALYSYLTKKSGRPKL